MLYIHIGWCLVLQLQRMKHMRQSLRVGLIDVKSEGFCQSCLPYPKNVMQAVVAKLPVIALKRNEDLLTIIKVMSYTHEMPLKLGMR